VIICLSSVLAGSRTINGLWLHASNIFPVHGCAAVFLWQCLSGLSNFIFQTETQIRSQCCTGFITHHCTSQNVSCGMYRTGSFVKHWHIPNYTCQFIALNTDRYFYTFGSTKSGDFLDILRLEIRFKWMASSHLSVPLWACTFLKMRVKNWQQ
jgi:hypothetical protein